MLKQSLGFSVHHIKATALRAQTCNYTQNTDTENSFYITKTDIALLWLLGGTITSVNPNDYCCISTVPKDH